MEVEMDASGLHLHHQQEMCSQTLESMLVCTKAAVQEKKPRPAEAALKCPRCDSTNTKFCYYNNYSLTQPRYFCKSCRRYWTKGGTLRNVPVGGGCRKNKRSSSSSSASSSATSSNSSSSSAKIRATHDHHHLLNQHPLLSVSGMPYDSTCTTDLSLAFARLQQQGHQSANGFDHFDHLNPLGFLEGTPNNGFHNVLYNGNGDMGSLENGGMLMGHELVKQETETGENRVLWGFPWQMGGGGDEVNMGHEIGGWNGVGSTTTTTWHGLLNSPLM